MAVAPRTELGWGVGRDRTGQVALTTSDFEKAVVELGAAAASVLSGISQQILLDGRHGRLARPSRTAGTTRTSSSRFRNPDVWAVPSNKRSGSRAETLDWDSPVEPVCGGRHMLTADPDLFRESGAFAWLRSGAGSADTAMWWWVRI